MDTGVSPIQLTTLPLSLDTSVMVVRVEVRLPLIAAWNMNPSTPDGPSGRLPPLKDTIRDICWEVPTYPVGRSTVHLSEFLPITEQVKTTVSLGQATPLLVLDVNWIAVKHNKSSMQKTSLENHTLKRVIPGKEYQQRLDPQLTFYKHNHWNLILV